MKVDFISNFNTLPVFKSAPALKNGSLLERSPLKDTVSFGATFKTPEQVRFEERLREKNDKDVMKYFDILNAIESEDGQSAFDALNEVGTIADDLAIMLIKKALLSENKEIASLAKTKSLNYSVEKQDDSREQEITRKLNSIIYDAYDVCAQRDSRLSDYTSERHARKFEAKITDIKDAVRFVDSCPSMYDNVVSSLTQDAHRFEGEPIEEYKLTAYLLTLLYSKPEGRDLRTVGTIREDVQRLANIVASKSRDGSLSSSVARKIKELEENNVWGRVTVSPFADELKELNRQKSCSLFS